MIQYHVIELDFDSECFGSFALLFSFVVAAVKHCCMLYFRETLWRREVVSACRDLCYAGWGNEWGTKQKSKSVVSALLAIILWA